eukprot:TRINITY_DN889_c0_g1_i2.p1 TRINITY_DN889_c0_g1~~TRINITY_DN889_c0_g1_i2.p1  ORF type:complete len:169 (+),score=49.26 TRINITY_DN889_c0_g1_i2:43-549(+)
MLKSVKAKVDKVSTHLSQVTEEKIQDVKSKIQKLKDNNNNNNKLSEEAPLSEGWVDLGTKPPVENEDNAEIEEEIDLIIERGEEITLDEQQQQQQQQQHLRHRKYNNNNNNNNNAKDNAGLFTVLPNMIIWNILSNLESFDLCQLYACSRTFAEIANNEFLWERNLVK